MKQFIIGMLICINLLLVAAVVFHAGPQNAYAQRRGVANYVVVAGQIRSGEQMLYVIDASRRMLGAFRLDTRRAEWRWQPSQPPRDLSRDFPLEAR